MFPEKNTPIRSILVLLLCLLLFFTFGVTSANNDHSESVDSRGVVSRPGLLNPAGSLDLTSGHKGGLYLHGWDTTLDSRRGTLLEKINRPAYPPIAWHPLPNQGLGGTVRALAVVGDDVYVGGSFSETGDGSLQNLGNIVRYDIKDNSWHPLPKQGLDHWVYTFVVSGSDLFVGGIFSGTGDGTLANLGYIVRFDTVNEKWHALSRQGLDGSVNALAVSGDDLFVGGSFNATGDGIKTPLGSIVRYDTAAQTWHAFPSQGLDDKVNALAVSEDNLFLGGRFSQTGDASLEDLGNIARYDLNAGTWNALPHQGLDWDVHALALYKDDLYVGGFFTKTGDGWWTNLDSIARYDPAEDKWHALPNQGLDRPVQTLVVSANDLYAGGGFSQTGDGSMQDLGGIVRYETTTDSWRIFPNKGLNKTVGALVVSESHIYVGGNFFKTGDGSLQDLGKIIRCSLGVQFLPLVFK